MDGCGQVAVITLVVFFIAYLVLDLAEGFASLRTYDHHLNNRNQFKNYYRIGYDKGKNLGWKPSDRWDHLRPEFSEAPDCYRADPIFWY